MGSDISEQTLAFATNHDIVLVDMCGYVFSIPQNGISHIFNGRSKKRIDYIPTRK